MKKKIIFALCLSVLLFAMPVYAGNYATNYCEDCGQKLITVASPAGNWTTTHQVQKGYKADGSPNVVTCTIGHTATLVQKICPNHGLYSEGTEYTENHSVKH